MPEITRLDYEGKKLFRDFKAHIKEKKCKEPSRAMERKARCVYSCFRRTLKRYKINEEYECSLFFYEVEEVMSVKFSFQKGVVVMFFIQFFCKDKGYLEVTITGYDKDKRKKKLKKPLWCFLNYISIIDDTVKKLKKLYL